MVAATRIDVEQLWAWLREVPDPEIPVVSVVDLGIVRDVAWMEDGGVRVTVTPTYSGCPATEVIGAQIREELLRHGIERVELQMQLSPAWTTDWLSVEAKRKLREYGIAPPMERADEGGSLSVLRRETTVPCPRCGSVRTAMTSRFGSTPCKALHRCLDCLEPFDHFKCH